MLNDDENWDNFSRQHDSQEQYNTGGAQDGVVSKRKANGWDHPFPNKPVIHRRPAKAQGALGLDDLQKICISTQQRGIFLPYHSNGAIKSTESRKCSQRMPSGEMEMAKAIHAKELILQEKLQEAEKKIRQTYQRNDADTKTGEVFKNKERQHSTLSKQEKAQKARMSAYKGIEEEGWNVDFTITRNKEDPKTEDGIRHTSGVHLARWEVSEQGMNNMLNKPRLQNENELLRGKTGGEKHYRVCAKMDEKYSRESKASLSHTTWTTVSHKEKQHKLVNGSDDEKNIFQKGLHGLVHRVATETQSSAQRKPSAEPVPPLVSNSSQRNPAQQQAEPAARFVADGSFQLLPCKICNRKFKSQRLEAHSQICEKLKRSRPVYNMHAHRLKGTPLEKFSSS